jgi:hypothetical protein
MWIVVVTRGMQGSIRDRSCRCPANIATRWFRLQFPDQDLPRRRKKVTRLRGSISAA